MAKLNPLEPIENPRKFREMLPTDGLYSVREQMYHLHMASTSIKKAKDNPSRLSLGDVFRLADMLSEPVEKLLAELVHEINGLPADLQPVQPLKRPELPADAAGEAQAGQ